MTEEETVEMAIRNLANRYMLCADAHNADGYASLFAPDGVLVPSGIPELQSREEIREFIENIPEEFPRSWHHLTSHSIEYLGGGRARGVAYYATFSEKEVDHWGVYEDEYRKIEGEWLFQKRLVSIDGASPSSPLHQMLG